MLFWTGCLLTLTGMSQCLDWQQEQSIHNYVSFRSVTPLKYNLPAGTSKVTWYFRASKEPDSCDDENVDVYLKYGSLPAVSPNNATFPDHFHVHRAPVLYRNLTADNVSVPVSLTWPTPGAWYAIAFLPRFDERIRQKGLFQHCDYKIASSVDREVVTGVETVPTATDVSMLVPGEGKVFRFVLGDHVLRYNLHLHTCNLTQCAVQVVIYHDNSDSNSSVCDTIPCSHTVVSPWLNIQHYVKVTPASGSVQLTVNISTTVCADDDVTDSAVTDDAYRQLPKLDRFQFSDRDFHVDYVYVANNSKPDHIPLCIATNHTTLVQFELRDVIDTGGTLVWTVSMATKDMNAAAEQIAVCGDVLRDRLPYLAQCSSTNLSASQLQANTSSPDVHGVVHVPYPEPGLWVLALSVRCYTECTGNDSLSWQTCSNVSVNVTMRLYTDQCVDNTCSGNGKCKEYIVGPGLVIYSTCDCQAGWRGYACSDGTEAFPISLQLEDLLLLSLSNLFFLPAIILAIYRGFYPEAFVYTYNMVFSAMYHACDGDRIPRYRYCMTDYKILSFCDFLASACSLWFTVVAMAQVKEPITVVLQVAAPFMIAIGVLKDHTSLWLMVVPLLVGVVLLATSWGVKCRRDRRCYPAWKRYVYFLLPGVLFAGTGAALFAFVETQANYRYIHSVWHVTLSLSIVFLLPPRKWKRQMSTRSNSQESIQELINTANRPVATNMII